jgi:transcriptional regulator with PAS, ATPase and Fis domain
MPSDFEDDATTRVSRERRGLRIPSVELVVIDGPSRGKTKLLRGGAARIGSAEGNDLRVEDPTVSRVHCEVRAREGGVTVRDRDSTNGTFVEGVRLVEGVVPAGAILRIGASAVRVDVGEKPDFLEISERDRFGELVGASLEMRRVYAVAERVARGDSTVLLLGETGTGKDVAARSIHAASSRKQGPFVPVDCGAIPEHLFESELFGHVRGAFSGAVSDRRGVIEEASTGTLFLDEIGELPLAMQAKLLRALETRQVRRVGANTERPVDIRLIAATNRSLAQAVNQGAFREDLYYRLAVVEIAIPPLRARREDIALLARHFYAQAGKQGDLPEEFLAKLERQSFPGNVRELKNAVERAVSLGILDTTTAAAIPRITGAPAEALVRLNLPLKEARLACMEGFEQVYVQAMLEATGGNVTHAAERAGVSRRFLQRLIARLGLRSTDPDE